MTQGQQEKQFKHTPAPWISTADKQQFDLGENFYVIGGPDSACYIAEMLNADHFPCIPDEEVEDYEMMVKANAQLIAAAPDLLAALKIGEAFMAGWEDAEEQEGLAADLATMRAAIAKATGKQ